MRFGRQIEVGLPVVPYALLPGGFPNKKQTGGPRACPSGNPSSKNIHINPENRWFSHVLRGSLHVFGQNYDFRALLGILYWTCSLC